MTVETFYGQLFNRVIAVKAISPMNGQAIHNLKIIYCFAIAISLVACSFDPDYQAPAAPIAPQYPSSPNDQRSARTPLTTDIRWQDYFTDPQLQDLIKRAITNNRDLRVMILRVKEVQAAYGIQRADQLPALSGTAAPLRLGLPGSLGPLPNGSSVTQYIAVLNTSWELDFWGRIRSLNEAALNEFLASDSARAAAQLSLITQVADTYLTLIDLTERLKIAEKSIETRQKTFNIFNKRYAVGSGNKFDLVQTETLLKQAQTLALQIKQHQSTQANYMSLLIGDAKSFQIEATELADNMLMADLRVGQPSDLLLQRPDIAAAEYRLKAANANIGAARAAFFPRISLNAIYGGVSNELNALFGSANRLWIFSPNLSIPIFEGGRLKSSLDLAEVRKNIAIAHYEKAIQVAFREVADNLAVREMLVGQVGLQSDVVNAQQERGRLAQMRYDNGSATYLEVLDAERDFLYAQQQLVQLKRAILATRTALFSSLGGGFKAEEVEKKSIPSEVSGDAS